MIRVYAICVRLTAIPLQILNKATSLKLWMDDLEFLMLSYSILVISGRWVGDNEKLCAMEPLLGLKRFPPPGGLKPGTTRSVGQRITCRPTRDPLNDGLI